jgi:hypothetical protein
MEGTTHSSEFRHGDRTNCDSPVQRDKRENFGNTGTIIEYNISRNDHARIFHLSGADDTRVEHNVIYVDRRDDVQVLLVTSWNGWSNGAAFRENTFDLAGTAEYGNGIDKKVDGRYRIVHGWGGARGIQFDDNRYFGRSVDLPIDANANMDSHFHALAMPLREPRFDPSHPERFSAWSIQHRRWMLHLFASQFKEPVQLLIPKPFRAEGRFRHP